MRYLKHVNRMGRERLAKRMMNLMEKGKIPRARPRIKCTVTAMEELDKRCVAGKAIYVREVVRGPREGEEHSQRPGRRKSRNGKGQEEEILLRNRT